ncbi:MAG: chromosomal replication initiator protein DnaA [Patescibacteria group bacterium]|nr:chromosomal replication initiator protein DnaA [Patescibacteria group bacterium]
MNKEELWQAVLAQAQFQISPASFATWFKDTDIVFKKNGEVIISTPNNFSKEWLENKYDKLIFKILHSLDKEIKCVEYRVSHSELKAKTSKKEKVLYKNPNKDNQLDFQELKINKDTNLNPRYQFENFIVGSFNELAHAASCAISKKPGLVYNPLFIYGGVGLGKTHLIQSIGNEITKHFPKKKIKYFPSEKFISGIVNSIRNHTIEEFKAIFKNIDVLIVDDIQFLAGKEKSQEEFFHIFNNLYEKNKQIILSSDRIPKSIPSIEERLRSRFEGGMIADVGTPDFETRIVILKMKTQEKGIEFSKDVLEYIASNIQTNIRELEGALNRLAAYQNLNNQPPDIKTTQILLKNIILNPMKIITFKKIVQKVTQFYDLSEKEIFSISRKKEIVKPRQIAMYLSREELKNSFPSIGRKFKNKDHTTAIYAYNRISKEIEFDKMFSEEINLIKEKIYSE